MTAWGDVAARARGLSTHLLSRADLVGLASAPDLPALATALAERGLAPSTVSEPRALERALRRARAARLDVIVRWCGPRASLLAVIVDDEDRRSVGHLLRLAAAGRNGPDEALGLTPTPALPERSLATLAEQPTPAAIAALLTAWEHPYGAPLMGLSDLVALERALHAAFASRLHRAARRGDSALRDFVGTSLDVENAIGLLVQHEQPAAARDPEAWLPGGARLDERTWTRLLGAPSEEARSALLALLGDELAEAVCATPLRDAESRVLRVLVTRWARTARREPLSTAPVIAFLLRQRAEALDLRAIGWGVGLGVPASVLESHLVTP